MVGGPSSQGRDPEVPGEDVVKQKLTVLPRPERGRGRVSRTDPRRTDGPTMVGELVREQLGSCLLAGWHTS